MDLLNWLLLGVMLVLLAVVLVLLVRLGDERDKLQQARSDLGVFQTARADYERRLQSAEADRDKARARVVELNTRLKVLADDAEYKNYLKTTHQLLVDFRDLRQAANELAGLRLRVENQRRQLQERNDLYQDHISLQEARHALAREQEDFEAQQRMTRADHERKVDQLQRANQDQLEALRQTHAVELQMMQTQLNTRLAALAPRTAEVEKMEQELAHRAEVLKRQSAGLDSRYEGLSRKMQDLQASNDRVAADLKKTISSFAALGRTLEGDGLVCVTDWRTYMPDEVGYQPRLTIRPMLEENDRERRLAYAEAIRLTETTLSEWIGRERRELQTRDQKLGALFEPKCLVPDHPETLLPRATQSVVPIIGGTSSGKTLYVTAMINELRRQLPRDYGLICEPADPASLSNFSALRTMVFDERRIEPTPAGKRDMIYKIAPKDPENVRRLTLFFRDIPGEYWQQHLHADPNLHGHFLLAAPCIMVLIDPLADPKLRDVIREKRVREQKSLGEGFSSWPTPEQIMTSVTLFLRKHGGYENTIIPKNLLMVLTKADLIDDILFPADDPVREQIPPARPFPAYRIDQKSDSIEAKLRKHDALGGVIDSLPAQYKSVRWFAASALGFPLEESYEKSQPSVITWRVPTAPKNVIDPILHSMWLSGLLT